MGCIDCNKKESLELPIPEDDKLIRVKSKFLEYVSKRNNGNIDKNSTFNFFNDIYETHYVNNPKQLRRSIVNMDKLYYWYRNTPDQYPVVKYSVNLYTDEELDFKIVAEKSDEPFVDNEIEHYQIEIESGDLDDPTGRLTELVKEKNKSIKKKPVKRKRGRPPKKKSK